MPATFRGLPPLRGLRVLEALWQAGSVTGAAAILNVSYPAISHQIRHLEASTDVQLFRREGRQTVLTEAGVSLARVVHESFVSIGHELDLLALRKAAPVTVVASPLIASGWLMPRIVTFLDRNPDARIHLTVIQNDVPVARDPDLLVLFRMWGDVPADGIRLVSGRAVPVAATEFLARTPIRDAADIASATRYSDEDMRMWDLWFAAAGLSRPPEDPIRLHLGGSTMLRDVALHGQGISLCREALIQPELRSGRLVKLSDIGIDEDACYYLAFGDPDRHKFGLMAFAEFLRGESQ